MTFDAKTTGSGILSDQQVDWVTLVEHRKRHEADHTLLVGPNPAAGRLMDRAFEHDVAVMSARQLAGLCRQHAHAPLGLNAYRALFRPGGEVDTTDLDELADDTRRLRTLAGELVNILGDRGPTLGRLTARDLFMVLVSADALDTTTAAEIQALLDMLNHPLIAAVEGDPTQGYTLATDPKVTQLRLDLLGTTLVTGEP